MLPACCARSDFISESGLCPPHADIIADVSDRSFRAEKRDAKAAIHTTSPVSNLSSVSIRLFEREIMPKYIVLVNFTDQGFKGVKDISNRQDKSRETAKQFGVERKSVWMTFGPYDFVHLYEAPNDEAMAKFVMTLASFGNLRTTVMRAWDESEHLPLIRELA
jgi:uncharacterized protein with GYD domain